MPARDYYGVFTHPLERLLAVGLSLLSTFTFLLFRRLLGRLLLGLRFPHAADHGGVFAGVWGGGRWQGGRHSAATAVLAGSQSEQVSHCGGACARVAKHTVQSDRNLQKFGAQISRNLAHSRFRGRRTELLQRRGHEREPSTRTNEHAQSAPSTRNTVQNERTTGRKTSPAPPVHPQCYPNRPRPAPRRGRQKAWRVGLMRWPRQLPRSPCGGACRCLPRARWSRPLRRAAAQDPCTARSRWRSRAATPALATSTGCRSRAWYEGSRTRRPSPR